MILQNLKLAFRSLRKNKFFSALNIFGLSSGVAVAVLIFMWVTNEISYDSHNKNLDRIFHVISNQKYSETNVLNTKCTPFALKNAMVNDYPEVKSACHYAEHGNFPVAYKDKNLTQRSIYAASKEFPAIFGIKAIAGDINCLAKDDNIIITDKIAKVYFGDNDAIGKPLNIEGVGSFYVGAVVKDMKYKSNVRFNIVFPVPVLLRMYNMSDESWGSNWPYTAILLKENANADDLNNKIRDLHKEHGAEIIDLSLKPFKNDRLYYDNGKPGQIQYIYLLTTIGFIIVVIAAINFINLTTARSEKRSTEIGVRKVNGAERKNIITQLLTEKVVMILICLGLALALAYTAMPLFNKISGKQLMFSEAINLKFIIVFILTGLIITILAGFYPALYMSSFNTMRALKSNTITKRNRKFSFRNILVIIQFSLSIALITCTIITKSQLNYIINSDIGYKRENLVYINLPGETKKRYKPIANKLMSIPEIKSYTIADKVPFWGGNNTWGYDWDGKDSDTKVLINKMYVDHNYIKTLGIEIEQGESFTQREYNFENKDIIEFPVILNQEAIRQMKMNEPIGKFFGGTNTRGTIVGVVKDFHFSSLHYTIDPLVLLPLTRDPNVIIFRIESDNPQDVIANVRKVWRDINGNIPISFGFFKDAAKWMYRSDQQTFDLFSLFASVAIIIACLGLLGLSVYATERRIKEIGVRKVNGATITDILLMLNKSFVQLVLISILIGAPIAYFTMSKWLKNFAYKTDIEWWMFAISGISALIIAVLTVSIQSAKAATQNPVKALKYE
jgi:predicted permease